MKISLIKKYISTERFRSYSGIDEYLENLVFPKKAYKNEKIQHKSPIELVENIKLNNALINDLLDEVEDILIGKSVE